MQSMKRVSFTLLAGFRARRGKRSPLRIPTKKAQALLAYLALHADQVHQRDKLSALLWGDTRDEQSRQSLRQALVGLRKALGTRSRALVADKLTVALDPAAIEVDVAR